MTTDRYQGFAFDPADLAEDVDIAPDLRREILHVAGSMGSWTHWQVLGVPWNASCERARDAYRERALLFHPDRYLGKRTGSYRARLERIFRRITEARDVLCEETARTAYAERTAPPEEAARRATRRIEDEERSRERRARLARVNPRLARAHQVQELVERGRKALAEERWADAARDLLTASALEPAAADVRTLGEQARRKAQASKAKELHVRARASEAAGDREGAQLLAEQAAEAEPGEPRHQLLVARLALARGAPETARARADAAVRAAPTMAAAHALLGEALAALGDSAAARRSLERALELDGTLEDARRALRKLRWSFLG